MRHDIIQYIALMRSVMFGYVVVWYAMMCCAMLWYAVLCMRACSVMEGLRAQTQVQAPDHVVMLITFNWALLWFHSTGSQSTMRGGANWGPDQLLKLQLDCAPHARSSFVDQTAMDLALTAWREIDQLERGDYRRWIMYLLDSSLPTFLMFRKANEAAAAAIYICLKLHDKEDDMAEVTTYFNTSMDKVMPIAVEISDVFKNCGPHQLIQQRYRDCFPSRINRLHIS